MYSPSIKRGVFVLEGLNGLSTSWYFYFIFFFLKRQFHFDDQKNLLVAAAIGAVFTVASFVGGRVGQRSGYFNALTIGFATMAVSLFFGAFVSSAPVHIVVLLIAAAGMCFTWPNLEAMIAEGESPSSLQRKLGIYNLNWSAANGVAYFTGGAILEQLGPRSIFLLPASLFLLQLVLTRWLAGRAAANGPSTGPVAPAHFESSARERKRSPVPPKVFLKMAWIANPFAYVAVNTAVPLIPFLAGRLQLTPTAAGIICSAWFFARTIAFGLLWKWDGWHYRYRHLAAAYVAMVVGFAGIVLAGNITILVLAQIVFGFGLGLIYYSSLFYSMDVGDTKGDHGGFHESAIGAGLFAGPALAYLALALWPERENSGVIAVGVCLLIGWFWMMKLRWSSPRPVNG